MSFELFRRIAHDAITTPDLLPDRTDAPLPATADGDGTTQSTTATR